MGIEATGTIHHIGETVNVSDKFTKREIVLVLADNPKYPQHVSFEVTKDKCGQLDDYQVGETVKVEFDLRGREWRSPKGETKYFNTLSIWKIARVGERVAKPAGGGSTDEGEIPFGSADMNHEPSPIAKVLR